MGTWCYTKFNTNDKDIANVIKDGLVAEFEYNETTGDGFCRIKYGIGNLDMDKIVNIATTHKSSFCIRSTGDYYFPHNQTWEFKNGKEVMCDSEDMVYNIDDFMSNDYYFYYHLNKDFPADEVIRAVENHDYETFRKLQQKWGEFYMPNRFFRGDKEIEINEDTFNTIDYAEYECG